MAGPILSALANLLLVKLQVRDKADPALAAGNPDFDVAVQKIRAAHGVFKAENLVRWTLEDIPEDVQEAYVMMGAALGAEDFSAAAPNPAWPQMAMRLVQAYVHIPSRQGHSYVDY